MTEKELMQAAVENAVETSDPELISKQEYLDKMEYEKNKIPRPLVSVEQARKIDRILHEYDQTFEYSFKLFIDGYIFKFKGKIVSMNLNKALFNFVVAIILLIFGTFMEGTAIAVLLVPVLWPIASSMGIDVIHFGMIVCISNVIGTMTPPVAVNIFSAISVTKSVRELKVGEIAKAEMPFFIGYVLIFLLCVFSETFSTFLVR